MIEPKYPVEITTSAPTLVLSPNGHFCAYSTGRLGASFANAVIVLDIDNGQTTHVFTQHTRHAAALCFSEDSQRLMVASLLPRPPVTPSHTHVVTWDLTNGKLVEERDLDGGGLPVAFAASGKRLLTRPDSGAGTLIAWDVSKGTGVVLDAKEEIRRWKRAILSADGSRLALIDRDEDVTVWDLPAGKQRRKWVIPGREGEPCAVVMSPDGKMLVAARGRKTMLVDIATGTTATGNLRLGLASGDGAAAMSPEGKLIAFHSLDLFLWSVKKREYVALLESTKKPAGQWPHFSADGRRVIAVGNLGVIGVWDLPKRDD